VADKEQPWVPFSVRQGGDVQGWNVMYEDVPAHLLPSLRRHVRQRVGNSSQLAQKIQRRLRLWVPNPSGSPIADIFAAADQDPRRYLDIADLLLNLDHEEVKRADDLTIVMDYSKRGQIKLAAISGLVALGQILTESSSAYAVDMSGAWRMVRRVDPTAQAAIDDLVKRATAPTAPARPRLQRIAIGAPPSRDAPKTPAGPEGTRFGPEISRPAGHSSVGQEGSALGYAGSSGAGIDVARTESRCR
jgi:hypothetical protein